MRVCGLQIYNESIHDLLAPAHVRLGKPAALKLKENKLGHIAVQGLSEVSRASFQQCATHLFRACSGLMDMHTPAAPQAAFQRPRRPVMCAQLSYLGAVLLTASNGITQCRWMYTYSSVYIVLTNCVCNNCCCGWHAHPEHPAGCCQQHA
jgi:hypothetical protein